MVEPTHKSQPDIILDVIRRVQASLQASGAALTDAQASQIERESRAIWGGAQVHVNKRTNRDERDSRIHRAYLSNVRLNEIARAEGVSVRRVLQIIKR